MQSDGTGAGRQSLARLRVTAARQRSGPAYRPWSGPRGREVAPVGTVPSGPFRAYRLVGAAGFEPTTTSPPDWCAPRSRGPRRRLGPSTERGFRLFRLMPSSLTVVRTVVRPGRARTGWPDGRGIASPGPAPGVPAALHQDRVDRSPNLDAASIQMLAARLMA